VENVLNSETLKVKEECLTKWVDYFRDALQKIHQDMSKFQQVKSKICENDEGNVTPQYFENINGFLSMGCKLERRIDALRARIIDDDIAD
jgi:cytochrome c556